MLSKTTCWAVLAVAAASHISTAAAARCVTLLVEPVAGEVSADGGSDSGALDAHSHERVESAAALRIRSELALLGYALEVRGAGSGSELDELHQASPPRCAALVLIDSSGSTPSASVVVGDPASERARSATFRSDPAGGADVLALRVAEFVEASLLELELEPPPQPQKSASQPSPPASLPDHGGLRLSSESANPGLYVGLGAGVLLDAASLPAAPALHASAGLDLSRTFALHVRALWSLEGRLDAGGYRARVSQQLALVSLHARLVSGEDRRWDIFAEAGAGAHRIVTVGRAMGAARGRTDDVLVLALSSGVGARWWLRPNIAAHFEAVAWLDVPRPVIVFPDGSSRSGAAPLLAPHIGMELSF